VKPLIVSQLDVLRHFQNPMVSIMVGFIAGIMLMWTIMSLMYKAKNPLLVRFRRFQRASHVMLVLDVDTNTLDLVPASPLGPNTLMSDDPFTPIVAAKAENPQSHFFKPLGRHVIPVLASGQFGFTSSLGDMLALGLAEKAVRGEEWHGGYEAIEPLMVRLAKEQGEKTGEVVINPNFKIGVSVNMPRVLRSVMNVVSSVASACMRGILENIQEGERWVRMIEMATQRARAGYRWIGYLAVIMIVVAIVLVILRQVGII